MEDKQAICEALAETLKLTREWSDIQGITYTRKDNNDELAIVVFRNGYTKSINVTMDSGIALIRDIIKNI